MDFDCASHGGGQWMDESASRRRQRRLSSPSLRAYLAPAFDAVAAEGGGIPASPASSYSSGGLELGFDASLLRYRRTCFSAASADLESRRILYSSPPPPPPPLPQARAVYPVADHDVFLAGGYRYGPKRQVIMLLSRSMFQ